MQTYARNQPPKHEVASDEAYSYKSPAPQLSGVQLLSRLGRTHSHLQDSTGVLSPSLQAPAALHNFHTLLVLVCLATRAEERDVTRSIWRRGEAALNGTDRETEGGAIGERIRRM